MHKFILVVSEEDNGKWGNKILLLEATNIVEAKHEAEKKYIKGGDKLYSIEEYEYQKKLTNSEIAQELEAGRANVELDNEETMINYIDPTFALSVKQTVEYSFRNKNWLSPVRFVGMHDE